MIDIEALFDLVASRRSIRRYTDRRPERWQIERIVQAASWAPSNHNRQGWKFVVFDDRAEITDLARRVRESLTKTLEAEPRLAAQSREVLDYAGWFGQAPVIVLAMHKRAPAFARALLVSAVTPLVSGEAISTAMSVQNLLLAAHALGLGACVMTAPLLAAEIWNSLPDMPPGFEPTCLITLGFPAEAPPPLPRKKLEHVLEYRNPP